MDSGNIIGTANNFIELLQILWVKKLKIWLSDKLEDKEVRKKK
jgi:hypothetical protein